VAPVLDSALLRHWARAAVTALERHRAEIDRINVFPVPDSDTGTNLLLTMRAAVAAAGGTATWPRWPAGRWSGRAATPG
jgi:dihydroxyacetone kinase-like predicted kinase